MKLLRIFKKYVNKQREFISINPLKSLDEVIDFMNTIPCINYGGCGISALAMYDAAVKEKLNPKIVYVYGWWDSGTINQQYKEGKTQYAASAAHVMISINDVLYDSHGEREYDDFEWFTSADDEITREHLVNSLNYGSWNSDFDRKTWLPIIEKFIGYKLLGAE